MLRHVLLCAAATLVYRGALAQGDGTGLYLFRIPSALGPDTAIPLGDRVQADLHLGDPARVVELLGGSGIPVVREGDGFVRLSASPTETLPGEPVPAHRAASFVIDFWEPSVLQMTQRLRSEYGSKPSIDALVQFVNAGITQKSYRRSFDAASQVAHSLEGDCTEHAVLLAALARATKQSARVVLGVLLVEASDDLYGFGHAWTEIHDGNAWQIADATRPDAQLPGARSRYLPLMELRNEGPGYSMDVMNVAALYPTRIENIRTARVANSMSN